MSDGCYAYYSTLSFSVSVSLYINQTAMFSLSWNIHTQPACCDFAYIMILCTDCCVLNIVCKNIFESKEQFCSNDSHKSLHKYVYDDVRVRIIPFCVSNNRSQIVIKVFDNLYERRTAQLYFSTRRDSKFYMVAVGHYAKWLVRLT